MLPSFLTDTYYRYKKDTQDIATWLATTARRFGYPADLLAGNSASEAQKGQRLKGKARKKTKHAAKPSVANGSNPSHTPLPKYTIGVKDFVSLAEYLAPKPDLNVSPQFWESIERAIRLRKEHGDYHSLKAATGNAISSNEKHFYFLGILERVREVLKPRLEAGVARPEEQSATVSGQDNDIEGRLNNMFACLTVEEPSESFLNAPDAAPAVETDDPSNAIYEVEPMDDPLELYMRISAFLQDCSKIRNAVTQTWKLYSQGAATLVSAAVTTDIAIHLVKQLEEQFLKDHPSEMDTTNARNIFFGVHCLQENQDPEERVRASDPLNLALYNLVEFSLLGTHVLLESFGDVLRDNSVPLYKPGFYGVFDESKDRAKMSGTQKFDEDKVILLEILSDITFFDYINRKTGVPAVDEFSMAVGLFRERRQLPLALDFAAQVHLDIRHILRGKSATAFNDLQKYAKFAAGSLKQNFEFHEKLRIDNWPRQNDEILTSISERIRSWAILDTFQQSKEKIMIQSGLRPSPSKTSHAFFISHPWLCGSFLFGLKLDMQEAGVGFLNAWGSAKVAAQIYNAARKEKFLDKVWQDMELALLLYSEAAMFVGSRPAGVEEYFRRFCLSMGYSAQNFATGGMRARSRPVESSTGPRGVIQQETISPIAYELRHGYTGFEDSGKISPDFDKVFAKCLEESDEVNVGSTKKKARRKNPTRPEMLMLVCQALVSEELALTFDHFRLHRAAWRLLRSIKERIADELRRIYTPMYIEKENQLPFIAGYIFMTAVRTKKIGTLLRPKKEDVVSSKMLMEAASVLDGMIQTGLGALEVRILTEKYGMQFEVERA